MQSVGATRSYSDVMRHLDRLSDDALLAAVALEERDAAAVFIRRFQRRVYGLAITMIGDAALADDLAQVTFERAWRHAGTYDARRASVATIDVALDDHPQLGDRHDAGAACDPVRSGSGQPAPAASSSVDPQQAAVDADRLGRLGVELAGLPVEQRRAVLLATLAGRTAAEIAVIEGIPVGTAKTRIRTGLLAAYAWRLRR